MTETVEDFFEDVVHDVKDYAIRESRPSRVLEETKRREDSLGISIASSLLGDAVDSGFVEDIAREKINGVAEGLVTEQKRAVMQAAELKCEDDYDRDDYERWREAFVDGMADVSSRLNHDARKGLEGVMRGRFDDITDHVSYYQSMDGEGTMGFTEKIERHPEESRERLQDLADYVGDLRKMFSQCNEVSAEVDDPVLPKKRRFHFKYEGERLLEGAQQYIEDEIDRLVDGTSENYGGVHDE
jgi:hypothetical protein